MDKKTFKEIVVAVFIILIIQWFFFDNVISQRLNGVYNDGYKAGYEQCYLELFNKTSVFQLPVNLSQEYHYQDDKDK